ncbi:Vacuolar protein sorting-associated protein 37A [Terramyces sp. JEL0728]|nr:Vacuolar protein sorting-associated protein 37A [Terramyces sp. JEL0728]
MKKEEYLELDGKTTEEIEEILLDDNAFADYFYSLDQVKPIKQMQDDLLVNNAEIAKSNLSRKEQIEDLKMRIQALQNINAGHRKQLDQLLYEQQQELTRFGSEYLTEQLRQLVATSDDMTELSAASFLEGKLSEDEFIKAFKESRKLYHLRNAKLETLTK